MHRMALTHSRPLAAVAAWRQQYQTSTLTSLKAAFLRRPQQFAQRRSQSKMSTETFSRAIHLQPTKNPFQIWSYHYTPQTSVKAFAEVVLKTGLISFVALKSIVGCFQEMQAQNNLEPEGPLEGQMGRTRDAEVRRFSQDRLLLRVFESKFSDFHLCVCLLYQKCGPMSNKKQQNSNKRDIFNCSLKVTQKGQLPQI